MDEADTKEGNIKGKHRQGGFKTARKRVVQQKNYDENSLVVQSFLGFQQKLDRRYDKRERIIKLNRDATITSKRVIFLLHRSSVEDDLSAILKEADFKVEEIKGYLNKIAEELVEEDHYQFARAFSGGLQEFVEAVTFLHYIKENVLLKYEDLCHKYLIFHAKEDAEPSDLKILLTPTDYILGIADLTGELMRMSINFIGAGNHEKSQEICRFLRSIHEQFLSISDRGIRDLKQKMRVLRQSLQKVEAACYTVHIRGSEVPTHMLIDLIHQKPVSQAVEPSE